MNKIEKYQAEADKLEEEIQALYKKQDELFRKIKVEEEKRLQKKLNEIHVGDLFVKNQGITHYHCDVLTVYEILHIKQDTNGQPLLVRKYNIHCYDGDLITSIACRVIGVSDILDYEKLSETDFKDLLKYFLNPQLYENSTKWNVSNSKKGE